MLTATHVVAAEPANAAIQTAGDHIRRCDARPDRRRDNATHAPGLLESWERGERDQFLVESIEPAIRNTECTSVGIKR